MACMNEKNSILEEKKLVAGLISEVAKIKNIEDFIKLNLTNMTNEKWSLVSYDMMPNIDDSGIYDMTFDVNLMGLPEHSYYDNAELVEEFKKLMAAFLDTLYPKESKEEHLMRAANIIEFEKKFKAIYPYPAEFRQRYTQPRKISRADFLTKTSLLKLDLFFKKYVPDSTLLREFVPESFEFLQKELVQKNLNVLKDILHVP